MTREEMIEQLENTILLIKQNGKDWWDERDIPILEEAIKAMKAVPSKDAVNRQDVLDLLQIRYSRKALSSFVYNLPMAFPEPTWGSYYQGLQVEKDLHGGGQVNDIS